MNKNHEKIKAAEMLQPKADVTLEDASYMRHFAKTLQAGPNENSNLVFVNIEQVTSSNKNLRKHTKKQVQKLAKAIKDVGYINPIIVNEKYGIIAGELRLLAAKEAGIQEIPIIFLENLSEEEADKIRILDNRIGEDSEWNFNELKIELEKLGKFDINFIDLGFDANQYDQIFLAGNLEENEVHNDIKEDESWLDENIPKRAKSGCLYRLGDHFLYCGDSLDKKSFEIVMQGEKAIIVFTDCPYNDKINGFVCGLGKVKHEEFAMASGEMTDAEFAEFISTFMRNLIEFSEDGSLAYFTIDWRNIHTLLKVGYKHYTTLTNIAVWNKGVGGMGSMYRSQHELVPIFKLGKGKHQNNIKLGKYGRYRTNVWDYSGVRASNPESLELLNMHPTVKPVALVHDILLDASSKNDIVLDCFGGSGSTLLAAERAKRRARLIEISPRYCDVIIYRWEKETGKSVKLVKDYSEEV